MFALERKPAQSSAHSPATKLRSHSARPTSGAAVEHEASPRVAQASRFEFSRISVSPRPVQRKATVSSPGDPYEREADEVADKVMRMAEPARVGSAPVAIQRKCTACDEEDKKKIHAKRAPSTNPEASLDAVDVKPITEQGGAPMPSEVRDFFESRFGYDFSSVRIHHDSAAAGSAQAIHARAYTFGQDIVFAQGQYSPQTTDGKRLLAHELAHVRQQASGAGPSVVQREPDKDHCGPIRGIAYTYRMAVQEGRMEDARKLLSQPSKEDAAYLHCRLTAPGDELAKFARAELSAKDVIVATNQLKRKLGVPEVPVPGAEKPKTGPPATMEEFNRLQAEVWSGIGEATHGFRVENDDEFIDYIYQPAYKQENGGWSKWIVFHYLGGATKEVYFDNITSDKPNQWKTKRGIEKMWEEDFLRIRQMGMDASMFVISAGLALQNPMGSPWAMRRGSPGMVRIPGLRGNLDGPPSITGAANDTTVVPMSRPAAPSNVVPLFRPAQPQVSGNRALDAFAQPGAFRAPLQDAAPFSFSQPVPVLQPGALDVPLTPTRFYQAPGTQFVAPPGWASGSTLPMGTIPSLLGPLASDAWLDPLKMGPGKLKNKRETAQAQQREDFINPLTGEQWQPNNPCELLPFQTCGALGNPLTLKKALAEINRRYKKQYGGPPDTHGPGMQPQDERPEDVAGFFYLKPKSASKADMERDGVKHKTYRITGKSGDGADIGTIVCGPCCDPETGEIRIECTVK